MSITAKKLQKPLKVGNENILPLTTMDQVLTDDEGSRLNETIHQNLAPIELTSTATRPYRIGEFFVYNNLLYKATAAIALGDTFTPGTNCVTDKVGDEIKTLKDALSPMTNSTGHVSIFDGSYATFTLDGTNYSNADVRICGLRYESADGLNVLSIGKMISTSNGNLWKYVEGNNVSGALFVTFKRNGTWSSTGWHVIGG